MEEGNTRRALIDNITDDLIKLEDYIRNFHKETDVESLKDVLSSALENIRNIRYNITYASEKYLSELSFWIREWNNSSKDAVNILQLCSRLSKASDLLNKIHNLLNEEEKYKNNLVSKEFDWKNELLADKFKYTCNLLQWIRGICAALAIGGTLWLGYLYVSLYFEQFKSGHVIYTNHLMLVVSCSPIIFLISWLFWQVGHYTRLIDIYTFKANLSYTLKTAIDYVLSIEKDSTEKKVTLETLKSLLDKLYDSPVKDDVSKSAIIKGIGETTKMLKEIKGIIETSNTK